MLIYAQTPRPNKNLSPTYHSQTSQLSRFGRETHNFSIDLTTAITSHDLAEILPQIFPFQQE